MPVKSILSRAGDLGLFILYPPRCGGCDTRMTLFCGGCRASVVPPPRGFHSPKDVNRLFCAGIFRGPLRAAIHKLKFDYDTPLAVPLAELAASTLAPERLPRQLHHRHPTLVPVPLHSEREEQRGYNQSSLLANEIAILQNWPRSDNLQRIRATSTQVGLDEEERRTNLIDAFKWQGETAPEIVMLVDDVCTTGATLSECASTLRTAGVKYVYAITVAWTSNI